MRSFVFFMIAAMAVSSCVPSRQYEELKTKQETCENERESLTNSNRKLLADNEEMKASIAKMTKEINQIKIDTASDGKYYRKLQSKYQSLDKLNEDLTERLSKSRNEGDKENRKLLEELRETQLDLQRREDDLRELERELGLKEQRLNDVQSELEKREARVKELENIIAEKDAAFRALKDRISAALTGFADKGLTVEQRNGKIYVSLEAKLLFPSGSTIVNADGKKALLDLSAVIKNEKEITILVEGHTDTDPFNGSGAIKDNWDLSVMRATSVVKIMTNDGGVNNTMLTAAGRGEFIPVADNSTAEGKAKNRRIEIILTPNLDKLFEIINE